MDHVEMGPLADVDETHSKGDAAMLELSLRMSGAALNNRGAIKAERS
jgi:hypothetical protein